MPKIDKRTIFINSYCSQTATLHDYHITVYVQVLSHCMIHRQILTQNSRKRQECSLLFNRSWSVTRSIHLRTSVNDSQQLATRQHDNTSAAAVIDHTASTGRSQLALHGLCSQHQPNCTASSHIMQKVSHIRPDKRSSSCLHCTATNTNICHNTSQHK